MKAVGITLASVLLIAGCTAADSSTEPDAEALDERVDEEESDDDGVDEVRDEQPDDEQPDDEQPDDESPDDGAPAVAAAGRTDLADDLYLIQHDGSSTGEEITIDVAEGDVSVLITFAGDDPNDGLFVVEATDPNGDEVLVEGAEPFNNGEVTLALPSLPDQPLTPGPHTFVVESAGEIPRISSVHKTGIADQQVIDVRFWVAATSPDVAPDQRDALGDAFRSFGDRILNPHGLGVGDLEFIDAPPEIVDEYAEINLPSSGNDEAHRRLCGEMSTELDPERAVNFVIVDRAIDTDDPDGETEGNAAGLPGAPPIEGSVTSCVFMIADGSRSIFEIGNVVWHEAGHLLGLFHTTEQSGDSFDVLGDTPECVADEFDIDGDGAVVFEDCPDGANFMFYDGDGLELTEQQAEILALHPLFRPA